MKSNLLICLILMASICGCNLTQKHQTRIAILTPISHPSLEQIEKGFVQTLQGYDPQKYHFDVFNAQGNKTLMHSEIEEIIRADYDMVFTIGTLASQMTIEVFGKKKISVPIVFTCVNEPKDFGIKTGVTGVQELLDLKAELQYLLHYKPDVKRLLLVYNPTEPGLAKDQRLLLHLSRALHIELTTVEVFQTNEIMAKVQPFMTQNDAVIILKDNTVVSGIDALVKLCNRHRVLLMASDLDSPDKGAAFGYGVHEIEFGVQAAQKALIILESGILPQDIPITPVSQFSLRINEQAANQQGVVYDRLHP